MKKLLSLLLIVNCQFSIVNSQPTRQEIMAAMECANDYFIAKYPDAGAPTFVKKQRPSNL